MKLFNTKVNFNTMVGKYYKPDLEDSKNRSLEIKSRNDSLYIDGGVERPLTQVGPLQYQFSHPHYRFPAEIKFIKDEDGKINYLRYMYHIYLKSDS